MHVVVAGPRYKTLRSPLINIVARGVKTWSLFSVSRTPAKPPGRVEMAVRSAGKVNARATGSAVCIAKYIGNVACCRVANWALGRDLKATMPPTKLWNVVVPRRMP
jgi:hypothetical protein